MKKVQFNNLIDLASEEIGGKVLYASDDFFAEKENLCKSSEPIFIEDKFTERGKWMDGWESRRRRASDNHYDECIVKLGVSGRIKVFDIDTSHFLGNHPPYASIEATYSESDNIKEILASDWQEVLPQVSILPGSQNLFYTDVSKCFSHLRLKIFPDGGVARLRCYGDIIIDKSKFKNKLIDLTSLTNGGSAIACSDMFFSSMNNLILPSSPKNMGEGWETKRNRDLNHSDWVILKLASSAKVEKVEIDTDFFKGNYPESFQLEYLPDCDECIQDIVQSSSWQKLLSKQKLEPNAKLSFSKELCSHENIRYVRLTIFPDGGIARIRLLGYVV